MDAHEETKKQWNTHPCGEVKGEFANRLSYFEEVERFRYKEQDWMHDFFKYENFSGKKVLEIGVGQGTDLWQFAKNGAKCFGLDITEKHLELTEENFKVRGGKVSLKECDAKKINFLDNTFDCVYSFGVLHHIPEIKKCFKEIHRVLKPGGIAMIGLYNKYSVFHLFKLVKGALKGHLFTLGYKRFMSTIEMGADGRNKKPYVSTWSLGELTSLFKDSGMFIEKTAIKQLKSDHFLTKKIGEVLLKLFPFMKNKYGWYVVAVAKKPDHS